MDLKQAVLSSLLFSIIYNLENLQKIDFLLTHKQKIEMADEIHINL
jgi:hypothetical protein